jgi:hypothetical protein
LSRGPRAAPGADGRPSPGWAAVSGRRQAPWCARER